MGNRVLFVVFAVLIVAVVAVFSYRAVSIRQQLDLESAAPEPLLSERAEKLVVLKQLAGTTSASKAERHAVLESLSEGSVPPPSEEERVRVLESLRKP